MAEGGGGGGIVGGEVEQGLDRRVGVQRMDRRVLERWRRSIEERSWLRCSNNYSCALT